MFVSLESLWCIFFWDKPDLCLCGKRASLGCAQEGGGWGTYGFSDRLQTRPLCPAPPMPVLSEVPGISKLSADFRFLNIYVYILKDFIYREEKGRRQKRREMWM